MAKNTMEKRKARREKSERNMNRAVLLLTAGLVAEWYLLMVDRYYARGTVSQVVTWYDALGVLVWVGLAALAAGVVLLVLRARKPWFARLGAVLAACGGFFAFSSMLMRQFYPAGVMAMCVLVPVLLLLGIVYLFYQAEFSLQATALAMGIAALVLLGRSSSLTARACAVLALLGIAALLACALLLKKRGGVWKRGEREVRVLSAKADYRLALGVPALCLVLVLVALVAPAVAFYATWVLSLAAFALAVYYTIRLM
ncbi:MAG: hypothetical protein K6G54_01060 [Oscillospiraceae bacterium]|nr:hypothetical protein [Oscillospiraceae bacterium]